MSWGLCRRETLSGRANVGTWENICSIFSVQHTMMVTAVNNELNRQQIDIDAGWLSLYRAVKRRPLMTSIAWRSM